MLILTPQQIREAEAAANEKILPYETMMEHAGRNCAEHIIRTNSPCRTVILCGTGKNGGDGLVIARHLHHAGFSTVLIRLSAEPSDPLSEKMRKRVPEEVIQLCALQEPLRTQQLLEEAQLVIDCLFGIGFHGTLPAAADALVRTANSTEATRIAIDIPSGLWDGFESTDTYFHAHETLTMLCRKPVHAFRPYVGLCGKIKVIPIGFGEEDIREDLKKLYLSDKKKIAAMFRPRPYNAHKGTNGNALLVMGCRNMPGAAVLAAKGCLSCGAGLVSLAFPDAAYTAVTPQLSECLLLPLPSDRDGAFSAANADFFRQQCKHYTAIAVGCGMSQAEGAEQCLLALLENYDGFLLIDADGINLLTKHIHKLKTAKAQVILTPHPGEMARLTGKTVADINTSRTETAVAFSAEHGCITVLKGADTVIAFPDGRANINPTGNPSMARGGSGDLLSGIITALLAQGFSAENAAVAGVYLHGLCGDIAACRFTEYAATIDRMIQCIPDALLQILNKD